MSTHLSTHLVQTPRNGTHAAFEPLRLRSLLVRNRLWLAPMCQYSAPAGVPGDWHLAHLGARASGGFGLLLTEATAVSSRGRISADDTGLWNDAQRRAWERIVGFVHDRGTPIAVQLAHAGRKASIPVPWSGDSGTYPPELGGWPALSVDTEPFPGFDRPQAASVDDLERVVEEFASAAARAVAAGFDAVEVLAGHGFLLHTFLSPLTNHRDDAHGADRNLLLREVVGAVRAEIGADVPLFVRLSATDWLPGGLTADDTAVTATQIAALGVDLVDVSSGGLLPADIRVGPGYQVPEASRIRELTGIPTAAAGLVTTPAQAEELLREGLTDVVLLGRAALRDPNFALRAAHELGVDHGVDAGPVWQPQYVRAAWS